MGVLNVTPDSFSDGGRYLDHGKATEHAMRMIEEGADIIDVGGESTRPGAEEVLADEEMKRAIPVIENLVKETAVLVSIDTTKAAVAEAAMGVGAHIVNDVSAGTLDPDMEKVLLASTAGIVLVHRQGTPRTMQVNPTYEDAVRDVTAYLSDRVHALTSLGIERGRIAIDPGIGFGKGLEHNTCLLARLPELLALRLPVLVGISRKRLLGELTGRDVDDRLAASLAGMAYALGRGAHIIRVHDVKESCDVARIIDNLRAEEISKWRS